MIKEGERINLNVKLKNQNGEDINLAEINNTFIVIYFYPKDDTPGCTKEACMFRDYNSEIEKLDAKIFGVSKDSIESHEKFKSKFNLNFDLLVDENLVLHNLFGTYVEKSMFGKKYMGTSRSTFIIKNGEVIKIWEKAKPKENAKQVYDFLELAVAAK